MHIISAQTWETMQITLGRHSVVPSSQDVSGPNRAKPMTATATAQVQAIWQQYFTAAPRVEDAAGADAAAGPAKEVQEVPQA
jgi:hypothetical protein